jgi:hypothetical protein
MKEEQMLEIVKYTRKPIVVDAVEVTEENLEEVAQWCNGSVRTSSGPAPDGDQRYVKVRVHNPLSDRQTTAFPGDHVLYANSGFKVYTPNAFKKAFVRADEEPEIVHRDAGTGQYVTEEYAEANPETTVSETSGGDVSGETIRSDSDTTPEFKAPLPGPKSRARAAEENN